MKSLNLTGIKRKDLSKAQLRAKRKEGFVPAVIYGGKETIHFWGKEGDVLKFVNTPHVFLVDLEIDGEKTQSKLQDVSFHPVTDRVLSVDFLELAQGEKVKIDVPVILKGLAIGVTQGGHLIQRLRKLTVVAHVEKVPDEIEVNVESLDIGKNIRVEDIVTDGFSFAENDSNVVAQVKFTRAAMSASTEESTEKEEKEEEKAAEETPQEETVSE